MPTREDTKKTAETAKRLRSIRAMLAQQEWLSWDVNWRHERFEYIGGKESVVPDASMLAQAQRRIKVICDQRYYAERVVSDVMEWRRTQEALLERAKYISTLADLDLSALKRAAKKHDPAVISKLVHLLPAEAMVASALPESPCLMLWNMAAQAEPALKKFLQTEEESLEARAMAALCLGRAHAISMRPQHDFFLDERGRQSQRRSNERMRERMVRLYNWGLNNRQLDINPVPLVTLLLRANGASEIEQIKSAPLSVHFKLPPEIFHDLVVRRGMETFAICQLMAALNELDRVVDTFTQYKNEAVRADRRERGYCHAAPLQERDERIDRMREAIVSIVQTDPSPSVIKGISSLFDHFLSTFAFNDQVFNQIVAVSAAIADMPSHLRLVTLSFLKENSTACWYALPRCEDELPDSEKRSEDAQASSDATEDVQPGSACAAVRKLPHMAVVYAGVDSVLHALCHMICKTESPELIRAALQQEQSIYMMWRAITDAEQLRLLLDWGRRCNLSIWAQFRQLGSIMSLIEDRQAAKRAIELFVREVEKAPEERRDHFFEALDYVDLSKRRTKQSLMVATKMVPHLVASGVDDGTARCNCLSLIEGAMEIQKEAPALLDDLCEPLAAVCARRKPLTHNQAQAIKSSCILVLALYKQNYRRVSMQSRRAVKTWLRESLDVFLSNPPAESIHFIESGFRLLAQYSILCQLLANNLKEQPRRVIGLAENLGIAGKFGLEALKGLDKLSRYETCLRLRKIYESNESDEAGVAKAAAASLSARHLIKRLYAKGWKDVIGCAPRVVPWAGSYLCSMHIIGGDQAPPQTLLKIFDLQSEMEEERDFLKELVQEHPERSDLTQRLSNLEERLASGHAVKYRMRQRIQRTMRHLASEAELNAIGLVIKDVFIKQLKRIVGPISENVCLDTHLLNALLLTQDVTVNKRLLKTLIKAHMTHDSLWRHRIPANQTFLKDLVDCGIKPDVWLSDYERQFKIDELDGQKLVLRLETEPIKILEMGNYFDTCLSFMGVNSFATIVNASDLNKRVVYMYDGQEKVIGRKLIGISDEWKMVGYRTYLSSPDKQLRAQLHKAVYEYLVDFAKSCRVALADRGKVPPLTSKEWYDDGPWKWTPEPRDMPQDADEPEAAPQK